MSLEREFKKLQRAVVETQIWKSIFRVGIPNTNRKRVLAMLGNVVLHLHPVKTRKSGVKMRYTWCAGGMTFFLFLVLTFTGLLLMFYYRPTIEYAFGDIMDLREQVPFGIMREMHRWGAHAMVIAVWIHMFRVFMTGSYKPPREFNWNIGVILLVLTLLLSFTGYLLPWDQLAIWAITVGSNMARATPLMGNEGPFAAQLQVQGVNLVTAGSDARFGLLGGRIVGANALLRFYVLHCVGIPLVAAFLMAVHFWRVRKDGGISGPAMTAFKNVINWLASPAIAVTLSMVGLVGAMFYKPLWTKKGGAILGLTLVGFLRLQLHRPELPHRRDHARQRADPRDALPRRLLLLVRDVPGAPERRAPREGLPPLEKDRQRQEGLLLARPRLRRADLARRLLDRHDRLVDRAEGAAGRAREPRRRPEPGEGAVVLPRPPGAARLLRPVDGGRRPPDAHHRGPHGDPVHRHEPARERLLLVPGAEVGDRDVLLRVHHPVGRADHPRHVPQGPELELLRARTSTGIRTSSFR